MNLSRNLLIRIVLIIILVIFLSPLYFIVRPTLNNPVNDIVQESKIEEANFGLPKAIEIPALGVRSMIEYVGILPDGTMGVPEGPMGVAWYSGGVLPGAVGNAVMAGHSGWKDNLPAVFDKLAKLKKGDKIIIEDERGKMITFIVSGSKSFDPLVDATKIFVGNDGESHLNLVTCSGSWDQTTNSHSRRLVVFADKELSVNSD